MAAQRGRPVIYDVVQPWYNSLLLTEPGLLNGWNEHFNITVKSVRIL